MDLPRIRLGSLEVSRLIVGGNPFSGISHQSGEADKKMRDYYTAARIKATLAEAERCGINTFIGRVDNHVCRLMNEYYNEGGRIQWIGQTAPEQRSLERNIRRASSFGARGCYIQGGTADQYHEEGKLEELAEPLALMRELGLVAGIAAHDPGTHRRAQEIGLDVDFYMMCLYNLTGRRGRILNADPNERFVASDRGAATDMMRQLNKPAVAYKFMAAGRNEPRDAFHYVYRHIKPDDAALVGVYTEHQPDQVETDVRLAIEAIEACAKE